MATYNGAEFLGNQIESILNQTYTNLKLYISDDNSNDSTAEVIGFYAQKDSRIVILSNLDNPGVINNFNNGLISTSEQLVFLCDQDDIWPIDRVAKMLDFYLSKKQSNLPTLIFTDMTLVDGDGNLLSKSFYNDVNIDPFYNLEIPYLTWRCTAYGCTMLFDRDLLDIALPLPHENQTVMHDNWLLLCASFNGKAYYMDYCSVLYRQHNNNHTGGKKKSFIGKVFSFSSQIKKINDTQIKRFKQLEVLNDRFNIRKYFFSTIFINNVFVFLGENILRYKKERMGYVFFYSFILLLSRRYQKFKRKIKN